MEALQVIMIFATIMLTSLPVVAAVRRHDPLWLLGALPWLLLSPHMIDNVRRNPPRLLDNFAQTF